MGKNNNYSEALAFIKANQRGWYKTGVYEKMYDMVVFLANNAKNNDGEAQYWLAKAFKDGMGVNPDYNYAFAAAQKSVNAGYSKAYYILGECYRTGKGIVKDKDKAAELFQKGMSLGDPDCVNAIKKMKRNKNLLTAGAIAGNFMLNMGKAVVDSGVLDTEGIDDIDD